MPFSFGHGVRPLHVWLLVGVPPLGNPLLAIFSTMLIAASVYLYNDLVDAPMDKLNKLKQDRPIANGRVKKNSALFLIILTGIGGLGISYLINFTTFLLLLSWFLLFFMYSTPSIRLKKMFIVKEIVTASGWPLTGLVGSYAITNSFSISAVFAGFIFGVFSFFALPALSDTFDAYEDGLFDIKTLGRALNWSRKIQLLGFGLLFVMTITPLTYARLGFSVILPIFVIAFSLILLRVAIFPIMGAFDVAMAMRTRKLTYLFIILTQIVVVISS